MTPATTRLIGLLFLAAAVVFFILNLKRVADLGTYFVAMPLLLVGIILIARSKRGR